MRYPVKSMRGEPLDSVSLTFQGFTEDRRFAFVQAESRSSFPWFTARELADLLRYATSVNDAGTAQVTVTITTPDGDSWPVQSEELRQHLEHRFGAKLFLLRDYRGCFDVAPVSLITTQSVAQIAQETSTPENMLRFRPNLLVELDGGKAYQEMEWVGRTVRIGDTARVAFTEADQRCMMITLDPATGVASPEVLKCVVQQHAKCAGIYGYVLSPGELRAGDAIRLE